MRWKLLYRAVYSVAFVFDFGTLTVERLKRRASLETEMIKKQVVATAAGKPDF